MQTHKSPAGGTRPQWCPLAAKLPPKNVLVVHNCVLWCRTDLISVVPRRPANLQHLDLNPPVAHPLHGEGHDIYHVMKYEADNAPNTQAAHMVFCVKTYGETAVTIWDQEVDQGGEDMYEEAGPSSSYFVYLADFI